MNGYSRSDSIRSPASIRAVTISPRPWSQPYSLGTLTGGVGIGVRADVVEGERRSVLPVRVDEPQLAGLDALVLERVRHRVDLGDVEAAAGPDEVGDDLGPAPDVGHPAEHAARGVDEVEVAREGVRQRRTGPTGRSVAVGEADLGGGPGREVDRGLAEVGAGDARPEPRPRERVDPEVALEVEDVEARDVADLLALVVAEPDARRA